MHLPKRLHSYENQDTRAPMDGPFDVTEEKTNYSTFVASPAAGDATHPE
ncbi:MAG: hypothetical protein WA510_20785 [Acidobacteriaceae bacterium]